MAAVVQFCPRLPRWSFRIRNPRRFTDLEKANSQSFQDTCAPEPSEQQLAPYIKSTIPEDDWFQGETLEMFKWVPSEWLPSWLPLHFAHSDTIVLIWFGDDGEILRVAMNFENFLRYIRSAERVEGMLMLPFGGYIRDMSDDFLAQLGALQATAYGSVRIFFNQELICEERMCGSLEIYTLLNISSGNTDVPDATWPLLCDDCIDKL